MNISKLSAWIIVELCCLAPSANSFATPAALYGKSVVISWTEDRMQRFDQKSEFRPNHRQAGLSIYISSTGRVFSRRSMIAPDRSGAVDNIGNTTSATVDFRGNTITALDVTNGGARRILATFDTDFAGCTAQVTRGKEKGAATIINHSIVKPGLISEIASVQISGVSCAVKNGNVFGSE